MYHAIRMHHANLACIMSVGAAGGSGSLIGVSTRLSRDSLTTIHLLCFISLCGLAWPRVRACRPSLISRVGGLVKKNKSAVAPSRVA